MKCEISVRKYQISRGQKLWTKHCLLRRLEAMARYLANLALEWNLKCGGVNQEIPSNKTGILLSLKTMVVGVDVTHPSPGSREGTPSIAGVVASIDEMACRFSQKTSPRKEDGWWILACLEIALLPDDRAPRRWCPRIV